LDEQLKEHLFKLKKLGFIASVQDVTKRDLLRVQQEILKAMHELEPNPPENFYMGLMAQASAFRLCHAIEVLETQGLDFLAHYLSRLTKKAKMPGSTKAIKLLAKDSRIEQIINIAERLRGRIEHPKISEVLQIVKKQFSENPNSRVMIFAHYRESADQIVKELNKLDNVLAVKFIGQASREDERGLSQNEQGQILDKFRSGEINVLVSTSVGEEGLDIPSVDLVIFYEAVPSEIRFIQRRGRTGRVKPGRVIALLAKGTRDEAFYWSAVKKERRMHEMLRGQREEEKGMVGQKALEEFSAEKVKVIADHREMPSGVVRELTKLGVEVEARQLDVGDFILSDRVGVERKSVKDFLQSIVDKRLMEQAQRLGETFERPMLILEGEGLYSLRAIHPNAIRGALSALAIDFGIPILPTRDEKETAAILAIVARREQLEQTREVAIRGSARKLTLPEQQRFIVEGLPGVSAVLAKRLLEHFGTVERVMGASEKELQEVHGIGTEKAKEIRRVLKSIYESTS
jgi:Fanconi anemia group M protein